MVDEALGSTELAPGVKYQNQLRDGGFSTSEIDDWKAQTSGQLQEGGFSDQEIKDYFGTKEPDISAMKAHIDQGIKSFQEAKANKENSRTGIPNDQHYAHGFLEHVEAGFQSTGIGMLYRHSLPSVLANPQDNAAERLLTTAGSMAGDAIPYVAGRLLGRPIGTIAGNLLAPGTAGVGGLVGGEVGGQTLGFAFPAALRKVMMDHYEKGDIITARDFWDRFLGASWEAAKGAMTGAAVGVTGVAAKSLTGVVGTTVKIGAEATVMSAVSKGLEGKMFDLQDILDNALIMGGVHAVGFGVTKANGLPKKLMNIFANTGEHPAEVRAAADADPQLKAELLSDDPSLPRQAAEPGQFHEEVKLNPESEDVQPLLPGFETEEKPTAVVPEKLDINEKSPQIIIDPKYKDRTFEPHGDEWLSNDGEIISKDDMAEKIEEGSMKFEARGEDAPSRSEAETKILSQIVDHPQKKTSGFSIDDLPKMFTDDLDPLRQAVENSKDNSKLTPSQNPFILGRNYRAWQGIALRALKFNTVSFKTGKATGEGLMPILKDIPDGDVNGLNAYLVSKRALELRARGIETPFEEETAKAVVDEGAKKFDKIAQRLTDYRNRLKDYMVDAGMLDPKKSKLFDKMNEAYVPFNYLQDVDPLTGRRETGSGFFRRIKGNENESAKLLNPIETIMRNTSTMIERAEKNRVLQALVDLPDIEGIAEKTPRSMKPITATPKEIVKGLEKQGIDAEDMNPDFITIFRPKDQNLANNEISVMRDGKREIWRLDPDVSDAVKALGYDPTSTNVFMKVLKPFAATLRAGTVLNPGFTFRHFFRSQIVGSVQSEQPHVPFTDVWGAIGDIVGEKEAYQKFMSSGAHNTAMADINHLMDSEPWKLNEETGWLKSGWNQVKSKLDVLRVLRYATEISDNAARVAEFKRTGGADVSASPDAVTQAAFNARNITIDNTRAGSEVRKISPVIPFLNVGIQGSVRSIEAFRQNPMRYTAMALATVTTPSILVYYNGKGDPRYEDAPQWEKDLYWIWPMDKWEKANSLADAMARDPKLRRQLPDGSFEVNNGVTIRVPKPFELGVLAGSVPERLLARFVGENPHAFKGLAETIQHGVVPNVAPPLAAAALEQATNHSFFTGNPLVSSQAEKELPQYQYSNYTSETAKQLGKFIAAVPLIRDIGGKNTKLASPDVIDNYIQDLSGTGGKYAVTLLDQALHAAGVGNQTVKPTASLADIPFVKEFVIRNPSMKAQSVSDFWDEYDKSNKLYATIVRLAKDGNVEAAINLQKANPEDMLKLTNISKGLSNSNQIVQKIYQDPKMTARDKRQLIDSVIYQAIQMAQAGNKMMEDFKKSVSAQKTSSTAGGQ